MRIILKILAAPLVLVLTVIGAMCQFLLIVSGAILGILSVLVTIIALGILITVDIWGGLAWLFIAFLISPYGLPKLAAYAVGGLEGVNYMLKDFMAS